MKNPKRQNKCCHKQENQIILIDGWSFVCGVCGRYNSDFAGHSLNKKESYKRVLELLDKHGLANTIRKISYSDYLEGRHLDEKFLIKNNKKNPNLQSLFKKWIVRRPKGMCQILL